MRHAANLLLAATAMVGITQASGTARAGTFVGAQDGNYRASDGDHMLIESGEELVGVQGLDCKKPRVENGRLRAKDCWANGHLGGGVDVSWRVEGNAIVSDGKRYVLLPKLPPLPKRGAPDPFVPSVDGWMHNRSGVRVDPAKGVITYSSPKPELGSVVKPGAIIYEGGLKTNGLVFGTAYAFKDGCPPASYPVRGVYTQHNEVLTLTGPGPVRKGCDVVGYSYGSPHAKLVFEYIYGD